MAGGTGVSDGGKPFQGVTVYKGRRGKAKPNRGVCGCGTHSCFRVVFSVFIHVCPGAGVVLYCSTSMSMSSMDQGLGGPLRSFSRINKHYAALQYEWSFFSAVGESALDEM